MLDLKVGDKVLIAYTKEEMDKYPEIGINELWVATLLSGLLEDDRVVVRKDGEYFLVGKEDIVARLYDMPRKSWKEWLLG